MWRESHDPLPSLWLHPLLGILATAIHKEYTLDMAEQRRGTLQPCKFCRKEFLVKREDQVFHHLGCKIAWYDKAFRWGVNNMEAAVRRRKE